MEPAVRIGTSSAYADILFGLHITILATTFWDVFICLYPCCVTRQRTDPLRFSRVHRAVSTVNRRCLYSVASREFCRVRSYTWTPTRYAIIETAFTIVDRGLRARYLVCDSPVFFCGRVVFS